MVIQTRKMRFKPTCKNPLAEKLKEKYESSLKGHCSKNQLKSSDPSKDQ